MILYIFIIL